MSKRVILALDGEDIHFLPIETDLSEEEIQGATFAIIEKIKNEDNNWSELDIINQLEKMGYIKCLEQGPETYHIDLYETI